MCNFLTALNEKADQADVEEPVSVLCIGENPDSLVLLESSLRIDTGLCVATHSGIISALSPIMIEDYHPSCIIVSAPTLKQNIDIIMQIESIQKYKKTPVIALIGHVDMWDKALYKHLKVRGIIFEPYDPISLSKIVRAMLCYY